VTFYTIGALVFINMFLAVIWESFSEADKEEKMRCTPSTIESFTNVWTKYDPDASGLMSVDDLEKLILDLLEKELDKSKGGSRAKKEEENILFNLHHDVKLVTYLKMMTGRDLDSDLMKKVSGDTSYRRSLNRVKN
jgi:hypothetical protein